MTERICATLSRYSYVESKEQHVAVLDDIGLTLTSDLANGLGSGPAALRDKIIVTDGFGADKAVLKVGMNHPSGLRRGGTSVDGPAAGLLFASGKEGDQAQ